MTPRYSIRVDRRGPANYCALVFRGSRMLTDACAHLPALAVHHAVEHTRFLRREGALDAEPARVAGGAL